MNRLHSDHEAVGDRSADLNDLIEKGFLLLGSLEFQIQEHLLANGARLPTETRRFLAQVRDTARDAAAASRVEARQRASAEPTDAVSGAAPESEGATKRDALPVVRGAMCEVMRGAPPDDAAVGAGGRSASDWSLWRMTAQMAAGAVCGFLIAGAVLGPEVPLEVSPEVSPGDSPGDSPGNSPGSAALSGEVATSASAPAGATAANHSGSGPARRPARAHGGESRAAVTGIIAPIGGNGYPGPRGRAGPILPPAGPDAAASALAERVLDLAPATRREVQRRLDLAGFDPKAVDGIFGPDTRTAIGAWQEASGLRPTGFLSTGTFAALVAETEQSYRRWRSRIEAAPDRERRTQRAVAKAPVPPAQPERRAGRCPRDRSGEIVYGAGVRCDFAGLRERVTRLFGRPDRARDVAQGDGDRSRGGA